MWEPAPGLGHPRPQGQASGSPSNQWFLPQLPSRAPALPEDPPPEVGGPDGAPVTEPATPGDSRGCGSREPWELSLGSTRSVGSGRLRPVRPSVAAAVAGPSQGKAGWGGGGGDGAAC